jgi:hypothetical protein
MLDSVERTEPGTTVVGDPLNPRLPSPVLARLGVKLVPVVNDAPVSAASAGFVNTLVKLVPDVVPSTPEFEKAAPVSAASPGFKNAVLNVVVVVDVPVKNLVVARAVVEPAETVGSGMWSWPAATPLPGRTNNVCIATGACTLDRWATSGTWVPTAARLTIACATAWRITIVAGTILSSSRSRDGMALVLVRRLRSLMVLFLSLVLLRPRGRSLDKMSR